MTLDRTSRSVCHWRLAPLYDFLIIGILFWDSTGNNHLGIVSLVFGYNRYPILRYRVFPEVHRSIVTGSLPWELVPPSVDSTSTVGSLHVGKTVNMLAVPLLGPAALLSWLTATRTDCDELSRHANPFLRTQSDLIGCLTVRSVLKNIIYFLIKFFRQ